MAAFYRCKRRCEACLQAFAGKLLQRRWPRSLVASADAADATVDIHTSSCAPLIQLQITLDMHVIDCPILACQSVAPPFDTATFVLSVGTSFFTHVFRVSSRQHHDRRSVSKGHSPCLPRRTCTMHHERRCRAVRARGRASRDGARRAPRPPRARGTAAGRRRGRTAAPPAPSRGTRRRARRATRRGRRRGDGDDGAAGCCAEKRREEGAAEEADTWKGREEGPEHRK